MLGGTIEPISPWEQRGWLRFKRQMVLFEIFFFQGGAETEKGVGSRTKQRWWISFQDQYFFWGGEQILEGKSILQVVVKNGTFWEGESNNSHY